jgi:excisionase family DNA binding protein
MPKSTLPELLTPIEAAEFLKVDVQYLYRLKRERRIRYLKVGHFLRFDPVDLLAWLNENAREAAPR